VDIGTEAKRAGGKILQYQAKKFLSTLYSPTLQLCSMFLSGDDSSVSPPPVSDPAPPSRPTREGRGYSVNGLSLLLLFDLCLEAFHQHPRRHPRREHLDEAHLQAMRPVRGAHHMSSAEFA
jgi:hypothetical protein